MRSAISPWSRARALAARAEALAGAEDPPRRTAARRLHTAAPMQTLTAVVFDEVIAGTDIVYTSNFLLDTLGAPDRLTFHAVVDQVTGSSPTLTVQLQHSADGRYWSNKNVNAEIRAGVLVVDATNSLIGSDASGVPSLCLARLAIQLGGSLPPSAHVCIYVCGRDA